MLILLPVFKSSNALSSQSSLKDLFILFSDYFWVISEEIIGIEIIFLIGSMSRIGSIKWIFDSLYI